MSSKAGKGYVSKKGIHLDLVLYIVVLCTKFGWYWTIYVGLDSEKMKNNYRIARNFRGTYISWIGL